MIQISSLLYYCSLIKFPGSGRSFFALEGNCVLGGENWVGLMVSGGGWGGGSQVSLRVLEKHTWERAGAGSALLSTQWALSSGWMDGE